MWGLIIRTILRLLLRGGASAARTTISLSRYGRVAFTGIVRNRPLRDLTQQQIRNAMSRAGMREAHNAHFISRLKQRVFLYGIRNLDDLARALNQGTARVGRQSGTVEIVFLSGRAAAVVNPQGHFITLLPL